MDWGGGSENVPRDGAGQLMDGCLPLFFLQVSFSLFQVAITLRFRMKGGEVASGGGKRKEEKGKHVFSHILGSFCDVR